MDLREAWRYYRANMYFYRIQGRTDGKPLLAPPVIAEPTKFDALETHLRQRFKTDQQLPTQHKRVGSNLTLSV